MRKSLKETLSGSTADLAEELWQEIVNLGVMLSVQKLFFGNPLSIELLNQSDSGFFGQVQDLINRELVLSACRLLDPAESRVRGEWVPNATLAQLQKRLENDGHTDASECLKQDINELNPKCEPFREIRNKVLGHLDFAVTVEKAKLPTVLDLALIEVIEGIFTALNHVEDAMSARITDLSEGVVPQPGERLLSILRRASEDHRGR